MSFPPEPLSNGTRPITATCSAPECGRPTVVSAVVCRVHLTDVLREQGEVISWDDPELAGIFAVAIHILRVAMDGITRGSLRSRAENRDGYVRPARSER
jgi:hypothetical protein